MDVPKFPQTNFCHSMKIFGVHTNRFKFSGVPKFSSTNQKHNMTQPQLFVKKLSENAFIPTRGSEFAAGYDLYAAYDSVIVGREKGLILTDLQISIPDGHYGRIAPRSGLAWKYSIDVGAGVIDIDYTGNVGVILFNHSDGAFLIKKGDRIAQLILEKISTPPVVEIPADQNLNATTRGSGGFGSTGGFTQQ
jgi:dUTP pyrophosphatase